MRKSIFFAIALTLSVVQFNAFAAPQRGNSRGSGTALNTTAQGTSNAAVSARAATTRSVKSTNVASGSAPVSARAGARQKVVNNVATPKTTTATLGARAAATQKVIQTGQKVAVATENTTIPQECQDAFYGCMDSFCMLDNASGGRCQCSDRIVELDKVQQDILKLNEQTYIMSTEGVERLQMGEAEEEIMARAKAAGDKVVNQDKEDNKKKSRTLDLSAWNNSIFSDDEFDDLFNMGENDDLANKTGDSLRSAVAKMCVAQVPTQCKNYNSMLQMVYVQKIKSDCLAYENSLKAQKEDSQQKLLTAQKALRDAALDAYRNENKYETEGQCVAAFDTCMQTTAGCGSDYSKCVADDTILTMGVDGSKGTAAKTSTIKTSASKIGVSANTLAMLTDKSMLCESVLKQCQKVRANVWDSYLKMIAPTLKSAEVIAESDRRMNCIGNVVNCFTKACAAKWPDQESAEYDMCLSNPDIVKNLCQIQINQCSTGSTGAQVMEYVTAKLNAMRVDACTKEVKDCLLSEDRCGADYAGCIGLDTESIVDLCPVQKLTACMGKYDVNSVKEYVAEVAQGVMLNIDNALAKQCQNAADKAMMKVCGSTDNCDGATFDLTSMASLLKVQACKWDDKTGQNMTCLPDLSQFTDDEVFGLNYSGTGAATKLTRTGNSYGVYATLVDRPDISNITFEVDDDSNVKFVTRKVVKGYSQSNTNEVRNILSSALDRIMTQIESDPEVLYCKTGRKVQGVGNREIRDDKNNSEDQGRFPSLTNSIRNTVASGLVSKLNEKNLELEDKFADQIADMDEKITQRIAEIAQKRGVAVEETIDLQNQEACAAKEKISRLDTYNNCSNHVVSWSKEIIEVEANYDAQTNVCTTRKIKYTCSDWQKPWFCDNYCAKFDDGTQIETKTIQMSRFQ